MQIALIICTAASMSFISLYEGHGTSRFRVFGFLDKFPRIKSSDALAARFSYRCCCCCCCTQHCKCCNIFAAR